MADFSVAEIKRLLQGRCPALIHELVPGCRPEGRMFTAPNPSRGGDTRGSFKIWPNGKWVEFDESGDDGFGKGDIINLIALSNGYPPKSTEGRRFALQWARTYLGLSDMTPTQKATAHRRASKDLAEKRDREERDAARRAFRHRLRAQAIVGQARPIVEGDDVDAYLMARGIDLGGIPELAPDLLRTHARLQHWIEDDRPLLPAMIAPVFQVVPDGAGGVAAVHCTFLAPPQNGRPSARKADVEPTKLILGAVKGGIVPLTLGGRRDKVSAAMAAGRRDTIILCEGIETGLSIALAVGGPDAPRVWACLSLGNIGAAPVHLSIVGAVIVAIENDTKPEALRQRERVLEQLEACGKPIEVMRPHFGVDANDVLRGG